MDLQQLQSALQDERATDRLQPLSESFYEDASIYITDLRADRDEAAENAPNVFDSREVMKTTQKIQRAEETLEKIYNRRVGKLINQAVLAATGGELDTSSLTDTEQTLYTTIITAVENNREECLDVLSDAASPDALTTSSRDSTDTVSSLADSPDTTTDSTPDSDGDNIGEYMGGSTDDTTDTTSDTPDQSGGYAAEVDFGDTTTNVDTDVGETETETEAEAETHSEADPTPPTDPAAETTDTTEEEPDETDFTDDFKTDTTDAPDTTEPSAPQEQPEPPEDTGENSGNISRVTVQVTQDVGEVYGVDDKTYDLGEEDVVSLPEQNAEPLIENNAAVTLD